MALISKKLAALSGLITFGGRLFIRIKIFLFKYDEAFIQDQLVFKVGYKICSFRVQLSIMGTNGHLECATCKKDLGN